MSLNETDIEAIARRVAEVLEESALVSKAPRFATAQDVAQALGVDRSWVYANQDRLQAIRLGEGPRARLRFDLKRAAEAFLEAQRNDAENVEAQAPERVRGNGRRASTPLPPGVNLITGRSEK